MTCKLACSNLAGCEAICHLRTLDWLRIEAIASGIKGKFDTPEDAEWNGSSLKWIRSKPSATVGKIGRALVKALCDGASIQAMPAGYSLEVNGKTLQVRTSTGWSGGGFKFQQLRNENYSAVFCLGITPSKVFAWVIPKGVIFKADGAIWKKDGLTPQHKGKGGSGTAWINVDVGSIPSWMTQYGDSIAAAMAVLKASF